MTSNYKPFIGINDVKIDTKFLSCWVLVYFLFPVIMLVLKITLINHSTTFINLIIVFFKFSYFLYS